MLSWHFSPASCRIGENASIAASSLHASPLLFSLQNYCSHFAGESTETQQVNELLKLMPGRQGPIRCIPITLSPSLLGPRTDTGALDE